jgi:hypothetical protein
MLRKRVIEKNSFPRQGKRSHQLREAKRLSANSIAGCFAVTLYRYRNGESSVIALSRDDVPHPAAGVFHVSMPPGDQMDMAVKNRLSRRLADIHPDVESDDGSIFLPDRVLRPKEEIAAGFHFRGLKVEQSGNVAMGDHQGVEGGHRVPVPDDEGEIILRNGAIFGRIAERASFRLLFE